MSDSLPEINIDTSSAEGGSSVATPEAPSRKRSRKQSPTERRQREREEQKLQEQSNEEEQALGKENILSRLLSSSASWLTSFVVHMMILIVLALWILPTQQQIDSLIAGIQGEQVDDDIIEVPEIDFDQIDVEVNPEDLDMQPDTDVIEEEISFSPFQDELAAATQVELADFGLNSAPESLTTSIGAFGDSGFEGRGQAARSAAVRALGGSAESEEAVALALRWLAEHQNPDGTWSLDHTGGRCQGRCRNPGQIQNSLRSGTALALLPFLGAGQTRFEGDYKNVVGRGLDALVRLGQPPRQGVGATWEDGGNLYAHGIAAIALCEAYGMTEESQLQAPAQAALNYIASSQNPNDGGWRYSYQQPGDTSVVGWQVMALKSGHLAYLKVPQSTVLGASRFLDLVQNDEYGGAYAYMPDNKQNYRASTSAVGLLCRMYLGWKRDHQGIITGVEKLAERGPSQSDFYHNYYASQVIFQYTDGKGEMWKKWNTTLRDYLVATQSKSGHETGSWYVGGNHSADKGGRLYCTAIACMNLEVYYRLMPIYRSDAVDNEFPE